MKQRSVKTLEFRLMALCAVSVLPGCATVAHADQTPTPKEERSFSLHPMLTFGASFGGDEFAEVSYSDGSSSAITAGGSIQMGGGLLVDFTQLPLQAQTMMTWHVAGAGASNGSLYFHRFPLELLGFYKLTPQLRLGGGLQYAIGPKSELSNGSKTQSLITHYGNALGFVVEGGYLACGKVCLGFNLRLVQQSYAPLEVVFDGSTTPVWGDPVNGQHFAFNMMLGF